MSNEVQTIQGKSLTANPFGGGSAVAPQPSSGNALMTAEMQRQIAEIQAQFMMALHRPRVPMVAEPNNANHYFQGFAIRASHSGILWITGFQPTTRAFRR